MKWAKDTEFGLAAHFYSRDIERVMRVVRVAEPLEFGTVGVDTAPFPTAEAPFDGIHK